MKRPRRNHTATYKAKVALAALKGDKTLAELSEKFDVHASQIVQWKTQLLAGAMGVFLTPGEKREFQGPSVKASVDERSFRSSKDVRAISRRIKPNRRHPPGDDPSVLPVEMCGDVSTRLGNRKSVGLRPARAIHADTASRVCSVISNCTGR
jgi:transposase